MIDQLGHESRRLRSLSLEEALTIPNARHHLADARQWRKILGSVDCVR
jgi:hypothetical protein